MSIFNRLGNRLSIKSKNYSRSKMEPLPTEIYQEILSFHSDASRPIDLSIYRDFKKDSVKNAA